MRPVRRAAGAAAAAAVTLALLVAGCASLPTSGEVRTQPGTSEESAGPATFVPPGPAVGANREAIVRGFLLATQANPPSTSVARSFLSKQARSTWKPAGTLVYDASSVETTGTDVVARLTAGHRLDARGRWLGSSTATPVNLGLDLILEQGEWRIQNPPRSVPIPASYFRTAYAPYVLPFFDRTGTVLVPSRVYLPTGGQVASSLVRGLLAGPSGPGAEAVTTAFGRGLDLDLSAVVNDDGVAEIPLSAEIQTLSQADLYRAAVQLAATLRQVPGVTRFRVTVDGIAVPMVNGQTDISVDVAPEFDPVTAPSAEVVALSGNRVVHVDGEEAEPVGGPFGEPGFALRSVAESVGRERVAAVSRGGTRAYEAPVSGEATALRARVVVAGAANLLPPVYDRFGNLWLVDAASSGAVVHVVTNGRDRVVDVPGVSGTSVAAFTVTRDGAVLVAGSGAASSPTLLVSPLVRTEDGRLAEALAARRVVVAGADPAPVVDLAQNGATTVAVLTEISAGSGRIYTVELDGSSGETEENAPVQAPGLVTRILASADPDLPLRVVDGNGDLRTRTSGGTWVRTAGAILTAAYLG